MKNSTRQWLFKLLKHGRLALSSASKSARPEIDRIKEQGFINWERSGRGGVYILKNHDAIRTILNATGYHGSTDNLPSKARAVAQQ